MKRRALTPQEFADTPATAVTMLPAPKVYLERRFAEDLGVDRERVAALRKAHLYTPEDFHLERNEVVLTQRGADKLHGLISFEAQNPGAPLEPAMAKFPVRPGPPAREKFTVMKVPANRHLLYCNKTEEKGNGRMILVRVKDNTLFMPRMVLVAMEAEQGSWQYKGRLPRRKGRW